MAAAALAVLGKAGVRCNRIGRRIVGLASGPSRRAGKEAPLFDDCGEDLQRLGPRMRSGSCKDRGGP
ncbi:hypothetical protein GCM10008965_19400 [Methylorubrum aminovorans]